MLASNLHFQDRVRLQAMNEPLFKTEALNFLANFRRREKPSINLRLGNIGPKENIYLITDFANGVFKVYSVEIPRVNSNKVALTEKEIEAILDAIPDEETFVSLERGFHLDIEDNKSEITVFLGDEWLFTIFVDTDTETYMIERNIYLTRDSDITPMVRSVGLAFNQATTK